MTQSPLGQMSPEVQQMLIQALRKFGGNPAPGGQPQTPAENNMQNQVANAVAARQPVPPPHMGGPNAPTPDPGPRPNEKAGEGIFNAVIENLSQKLLEMFGLGGAAQRQRSLEQDVQNPNR